MGVFGIIGEKKENVASSVYYALFSLQHRGQESAGIVVNDDGVFKMRKDSGARIRRRWMPSLTVCKSLPRLADLFRVPIIA